MNRSKASTTRYGRPWDTRSRFTRLSREDVELKLTELEAKYGMSSQEFAGKWNRGELDCGVMDYFDWEGHCDYMARKHGVKELEIVYTNVQELKIE